MCLKDFQVEPLSFRNNICLLLKVFLGILSIPPWKWEIVGVGEYAKILEYKPALSTGRDKPQFKGRHKIKIVVLLEGP